ncbi:MAG: hypothetical protein ACRCZ2_08225 [Fusobacteriaceae bacterium]
MKIKIFYLIATFLFGIGINQNTEATQSEVCYTSGGLEATTNDGDNLYVLQNTISDTLRVKTRSMIYDLKDDGTENDIEETRLGKVIDIAISKRTGDGNLQSGYMFLTIVNKNE